MIDRLGGMFARKVLIQDTDVTDGCKHILTDCLPLGIHTNVLLFIPGQDGKKWFLISRIFVWRSATFAPYGEHIVYPRCPTCKSLTMLRCKRTQTAAVNIRCMAKLEDGKKCDYIQEFIPGKKQQKVGLGPDTGSGGWEVAPWAFETGWK
jgi:hypothetical protein